MTQEMAGRVRASPPEERVAEAGATWARRTGRNVAALAVARGVSAVASLVLVGYLTRTLAPDAFGVLNFGAALLSYFVLFVNLGFNTLGTREVARSTERAAVLVEQITGIKLILAVVAYVAFLGVAFVLPEEPLLRLVLAIQGGALFANALSVEWVYQGFERMGVLAVRNVAVVAVQLGAVFLLVRTPDDVVWAAAAATGALLLLNGWLFASLVRELGRLRLDVRPAVWRDLLPPALPIAASAFMISVYYNLDQVMLGLMRSAAEVGLYATGWRALLAALLPVMIVGQAFFPTLAAVWGDPALTRVRMRSFVSAAVPAGFMAAAVGVLFARPLLVVFAGEAFAPGAPAFALLMVDAAIVSLNVVFSQPLMAWDRQKVYMFAVGSGAVINVGLNFLLIPAYGSVGAALATLMAEGVVLVWMFAAYVRLTHETHLDIIVRAALAAGVGVVLPVLVLRVLGAPLLAQAGVAALAYGALAWALGLVPVQVLRQLVRRAPDSPL